MYQLEQHSVPLRASLLEEESNYNDEIEYIKLCIEEEIVTRQAAAKEASMVPPSITELKQFRSRVEKMVEDAQTRKAMERRLSLPPKNKFVAT